MVITNERAKDSPGDENAVAAIGEELLSRHRQAQRRGRWFGLFRSIFPFVVLEVELPATHRGTPDRPRSPETIVSPRWPSVSPG